MRLLVLFVFVFLTSYGAMYLLGQRLGFIAKVGDPGWKGPIGSGLAALIFSVILISYLFH
jgi:hypothetical protein